MHDNERKSFHIKGTRKAFRNGSENKEKWQREKLMWQSEKNGRNGKTQGSSHVEHEVSPRDAWCAVFLGTRGYFIGFFGGKLYCIPRNWRTG